MSPLSQFLGPVDWTRPAQLPELDPADVPSQR